MPERDAISCNLGDDYLLIAAGLRREKSGDLTADVILKNGKVLHADRGILNTAGGRHAWATKAAAKDAGGPTAERMSAALQEHVLPDALAVLQAEPKKPTQADQLVGIVTEESGDFAAGVAGEMELFHDPNGSAYATIPIGEHRETWPLGSKGFRQWLARRFHEQHGKTPNAQALADAAAVLAGKALFDGPEHRVHLRVAEHEGILYLDLCNAPWSVVAVDHQGWRIVTNPPVKFRRTRGMLALPCPEIGGSLATLRQFVNLPSGDAAHDATWTMLVSWLIGAFRPRGPYPLLNVMGEHGSAKSTLSRLLRGLLDPNKAPIRSLPRDERDLMIAGTNGWVLAFDNLSALQDWQSDALCRIATGGGFAARELYSDQDETILDVQRPIILNGIEEIVVRPDLQDRSLNLRLPSIPQERRMPEKRFWREFEQERPAILGAILDAVSTALRNESTVALATHPRMADFAEWIVAAEPVLPWEAGTFLRAYETNQQDANDLTLEASPVAQATREFMERRAERWIGSATDLLSGLESITSEQIRKQKSWPASARTLGNTLRRLAPNLRAVDIDVTFDRTGRKRLIRIERVGDSSSSSSSSSSSAPGQGISGDDESGDDDALRHADAPSSSHPSPEPTEWWAESTNGDDSDDGDDEMSTHSEWWVNPDGSEEGLL